MRLPCLVLILLLGGGAGALSVERDPAPPWGFFAHRRINRLAVYTLPPELAVGFRPQADYLAEHAVDPDKRRYATEQEAVRHYIDLDHWGELPFTDLPRSYLDARMWRGGLDVVTAPGDTTHWRLDTVLFDQAILTSGATSFDLPLADYRTFWINAILPSLYEGRAIAADSLRRLGFPDTAGLAYPVDNFSEHGILPYHLLRHHRQLTDAFVAGDADRILQLAAELGHYIGDAHVPLHTTENYNGQLTGQLGIHAFWESRLPELFADTEYDYFVGAADYIVDPSTYYWDIVLQSHARVDSVLATEAGLRQQFATDQQLCVEERLGREVRTQCRDYAAAWSAAMDGMVEDRFRAAVRAVGSAWYSCWVDAGQPVLDDKLAKVIPVLPVGETKRSLPTGSTGRLHE